MRRDVVVPPVPEERALHESPLVPVTVHERTLPTFQKSEALLPALTKVGRAWRCPVREPSPLNSGVGSRHTAEPVEQ